MTVYAEILFIENFVTGWVILKLTGKLRGQDPGRRRTAAGAAMCGVYSFVLFVPLHWAAALGLKVMFSLVVTAAAFGMTSRLNIIKTAGIFCIVSFLMGGVTIALMYMIKLPFMTANGSFVLKGNHFIQVAAGVAATWFLGVWLAGLTKEKCIKEKILKEVEIHIGDHVWDLNALIDTGNSLNEPVTGRPVAVISRTAGKIICEELGPEQDTRSCVIPYKTIGEKGIMYGIKPDFMVLDDRKISEIVLGIGENDFSLWKGCEEYELLLNWQFLKGEE